MVSKNANKILNFNKTKHIPSPGATQLGSPGYDNPRDDIEKIKSLREGSVVRTPTEEFDMANKAYVDSVASRDVVDLFLTNNASDIGGYKDLEIDVVTAAKETITQAITGNSTTLIASFASILGEDEVNNIEILESGIYDLHIHASTNFAAGMTIYYEFYHRTAGGTETLLTTSHDSPILSGIEQEYDIHAGVTVEKNFISGDRIVAKVYGRNVGAATKNISIFMEGGTASRLEFPGFVSPSFPVSQAWPIGSVFMSVVSTNPATLLGIGTWSAIGAGRVLVGLDSGDTDFDTVEETGGSKTHSQTFTGNVVANHEHTGETDAVQDPGTCDELDNFSAGLNTYTVCDHTHPFTTSSDGEHTPSGTISSGNSVQPYFVVFMWKRTA